MSTASGGESGLMLVSDQSFCMPVAGTEVHVSPKM